MTNIVAKFANAETGISSAVMQTEDGHFNVIAFDTDADRVIEIRNGFTDQAIATKYASAFMAE